jgi:hypothetical protein
VLKQNLESFDAYQRQLTACDAAIRAQLQSLAAESTNRPAPLPAARSTRKPRDNEPGFEMRTPLHQLTGAGASHGESADLSGIRIDVRTVRRTPGISCDAPKLTGVRQLHPLVGRLACFPGLYCASTARPIRKSSSRSTTRRDTTRVPAAVSPMSSRPA